MNDETEAMRFETMVIEGNLKFDMKSIYLAEDAADVIPRKVPDFLKAVRSQMRKVADEWTDEQLADALGITVTHGKTSQPHL